MNFKEKADSLKAKIQAKITPESTPEQIEEANAYVSDLDELSSEHDRLVAENAKFKDTIVKMVTTQGDAKPPKDASQASESMSIEEAIAKISKEDK